MARLTERAFENAVVRLRDGQGALGQSALDVLHEQREELANQMLARLAGSDQFAAMLERNFGHHRRLMTYYECAMMEVETKFRVLDAEYGLQHDRNPIESIKTRLKSTDSLAKKLARKGFPMYAWIPSSENIFDVAGVRVVCTFPEDMFTLAECAAGPRRRDTYRAARLRGQPRSRAGTAACISLLRCPFSLSARSAR